MRWHATFLVFIAILTFAEIREVAGLPGSEVITCGGFPDFSSCINSPITAGKTILIPSTLRANSVTVPLNRTVRFDEGGSLEIAAGNTLVFQGMIDAGSSHIFRGPGMAVAPNNAAVRPEWWGARGDGITDDGPALMTMNASLRQGDSVAMRTIRLSSGKTYIYTINKWAQGLHKLSIEGNGARLQNRHPGPAALDLYPLVVTSSRGFYNSDGSEDHGAIIDTTKQGETFVTVKSPVDARRFSAGSRVLITSFDRQFYGYPPNNKYFEFARVSSVEKNRVLLDRPLLYAHRDDLPELATYRFSHGKARIFNLDKDPANFIMDSFTLRGVTILDNPAISASGKRSSNYLLIAGVEESLVEDCTLTSYVPTIGGRFVIRNSKMWSSEPDKLLEEVVFDNCTIETVLVGGGARRITVRGCSIGGKVEVYPDHLTIENSTLQGAAEPGNYKAGVFPKSRELVLTGNHFVGKNGPSDYAVWPTLENLGSNNFIPVAGNLLENRRLILPLGSWQTSHWVAGLELGKMIYVCTNTTAGFVPSGIKGRVVSLTGDGLNALVDIAFTESVPDKAYLVYPRVGSIVMRRNTYENVNPAGGLWIDESATFN